MCGICGVVDTSGPVDLDVLERMTGTLRHRGPDDAAYYLPEPDPAGPAVGFGFRRLSIIDVEGGRQPLANEDESVWTMLNGEIYNFAELRAGLEADGHVFRTNGDAETLVHLYEESGVDCTERLNGMFAFAVWDTSATAAAAGARPAGQEAPLLRRARRRPALRLRAEGAPRAPLVPAGARPGGARALPRVRVRARPPTRSSPASASSRRATGSSGRAAGRPSSATGT